MSCALTSAAEAGLITSRARRSSSVHEGLLEIPERFELHHGGVLAGVRVAWRLAGAARGPVVAVLGGISAGREVFGTAGDHGWWNARVGPARAVDSDRLGVLSPPRNKVMPSTPSLPTTRIAVEAPLSMTYCKETMESVGK